MFGVSEVLIIALSSLIIFLIKTLDRRPAPIFGIYCRPSGVYWLKVGCMFIVLSLRKVIRKLKKQDKEKLGKELDKVQSLSHHEKAIDAVYLNGANKNGDRIVVGLARRKDLLVDGFVYLKINSSNLGILETPKLPDTALYQSEQAEKYEAEGIRIAPFQPMKVWVLSYQGEMKEAGNPDVEHDVKIEGMWSSNIPYFSFDTDMDPLFVAKAISLENWSKDYFKTAEESHQTHYEQFGQLNAVIEVDGESYVVNMDTVRDHSFGFYREWRNFHRYALHFATTENGDRFSIGFICIPITLSRVTVGFVYSAEDKQIYPVRDCDMELYQHGNMGTPPEDYAFTFSAGRRTYTMQVNVLESAHFYISKNWESKIFERFCTFEVNGIKGWGCTEWQYRNINGRKIHT